MRVWSYADNALVFHSDLADNFITAIPSGLLADLTKLTTL